MNRRFRVGPLKGEPRYRRFLAFDVETRDGPEGGSEFVIGCVFDGDEFKVFHDRLKMIDCLRSRQYAGYTAWSCNLEYDLLALFQEPTWPLFFHYFGGILKGAKLLLRSRQRPGRGEATRTRQVNSQEWLHFADTLNHWGGGVETYGLLIGLPKLQMPEVVPGKELETYCMRDAEIVYRMVERSQEYYNRLGCELKGTLASSAKDLFRRRYFNPGHSFRPLSKHLLDTFRGAYYGARTENFVRGTYRNVYMGDVVSMYPHVMRSIRIPLLDSRLPASHRIRDGLEGFACVDVEVRKDESYYPPLPFRYDKLYFPAGKWTGLFPLNELRYAETHGARVTKVHFAVQFQESDFVFRDYIDNLFPLKKQASEQGNQFEERLIKLFMNSLYGVFATGCDALSIGPFWSSGQEDDDDEIVEVFSLSGYTCAKKAARYPRTTNFVWPMYITAQARVILHGYLTRFNGLYCDTDSVATKSELKPCKELGALDLKYFTKEIEIMAPKVYKDDQNVKVKGVPKSAVAVKRIETTDGLCLQARFMTQTEVLADRYFYQKVSRFRESIRRGIPPNTWDWVEKRLRREGEKRRFFKNGDSEPLEVSEITERPLAPGARSKVLPSFYIRPVKLSV